MEIQSLFPSSAASSATNGRSAANLADTFDSFLKLLTTQLKHQDPLSPLNPTEFTTQLVQFTNVEQQIRANDSLKQLISLQERAESLSVAGFLGRTVEVAGSFAPLEEGGSAAFSYSLPSEAQASLIRIFDAKGSLVHMTAGETSAGRHDYLWDGTDAEGDPLPAGAYSIRVSAADGNGPLSVPTTVTGRVTAVSAGATGPVLALGDVTVGLDSVLRLLGAQTAAAPEADTGWF